MAGRTGVDARFGLDAARTTVLVPGAARTWSAAKPLARESAADSDGSGEMVLCGRGRGGASGAGRAEALDNIETLPILPSEVAPSFGRRLMASEGQAA